MRQVWVKDLHCFSRQDVIKGVVEERYLMMVKGSMANDALSLTWKR